MRSNHPRDGLGMERRYEPEHGHLPRRDGRPERDTCAAGRRRRQQKTALPHGDERCRARGTTPLRRSGEPEYGLCLHGAGAIAQCSGSITGAGWFRAEPRHRLLTPGEGALGVRLRGLIVLAIPIPLHSNRGSLYRSRQGPVPINAVAGTLASAVDDVKRLSGDGSLKERRILALHSA